MTATGGTASARAHRHHHAATCSPDTDRRWLILALVLIVGYLVAEVTVGLLARSLALLTDAAHMLTDAAAIVLALAAIRLSARRPTGGYTYGFRRAEILSAHANGLTLLLLALWLGAEAVRRLLHPPAVDGRAVLVTALAGIAVNTLVVSAIGRANRESLNIRGAYLHVLTDLIAFVATAVAGLVVAVTGFTRADAVASIVVVTLMIKAGLGLVAQSVRIFLEAAPAGVDPPAVAARLASLTDVVEVHDLHVWQITSTVAALSAHVVVTDDCDCHAVRVDAATMLREAYGIGHVTLQLDHAKARTSDGPLPQAQMADGPRPQARTPDGSRPDAHCGATATATAGVCGAIASSVGIEPPAARSASSPIAGHDGPPATPQLA